MILPSSFFPFFLSLTFLPPLTCRKFQSVWELEVTAWKTGINSGGNFREENVTRV